MRISNEEMIKVLMKIFLNNSAKTTKQILSDFEYKKVYPHLLDLGYIGVSITNKNYSYVRSPEIISMLELMFKASMSMINFDFGASINPEDEKNHFIC